MKKILLTLVALIISSYLLYKYWDIDSDLGDGYYFLTEYEAEDIGFIDGAVIYKSPKKM